LLKIGLKTLIQNRSTSLPVLLVIAGVMVLFFLCKQMTALPLLGDHCMKTSKSVEVSYNIVRYKDPFHQYADWQVTKDNLFGETGSIVGYESPLSALLLASLYLVVDSADFMTRLNTARYFTLFHLLGCYFLLAFFVLRKDLFSLALFSILFVASTFTIAYSTQPFVESMSLLYQALFMVVAVRLLGRNAPPTRKALLIGLAAFLLCVGGKMNYFLIGLPVILGFPFLDRTLVGWKPKLRFLAIFAGGGILLLLGLAFFTELDLRNIFIYMIKGNKPIINGNLWQTFMEGFSGFEELAKRTKEDFGYLPYTGGLLGGGYLAVKFVGLSVLKRKKPVSAFESFQLVLFLFVLGHALNYVVLRNLYIPHRYYVIPLYTVFCLAFTVLVADIRTVLFYPLAVKSKIRERVKPIFERRFPWLLSSTNGKRLSENSVVTVTVLLLLLALVAFVAAHTFETRHNWQTTFILASKSLGSRALGIELLESLTVIVRLLYRVSVALLTAAVGVALGLQIIKRKAGVRGVIGRANRLFSRWGITLPRVIMGLFLAVILGFSTLKTGRTFWLYAASYKEHIENANALAKIRRDTKSGDLVLAWKWCMAFYADKRSITDATVKDIAYYRENNIHSVMGPVKPLNHYYKRIEKYPEPMSYWRPLTKEELRQRREKARKKKTK
jgi:hypothetical protein